MASELWQRIREARRRADVSQEEVAVACGIIARNAVSLWERKTPDGRTTPTLTNVMSLARLTGAPYEWLLSDESDLDDDWEQYRPARVAERSAVYNVSPRAKAVLDHYEASDDAGQRAIEATAFAVAKPKKVKRAQRG